MLRNKNLRRAIAIGTLTPALVIGVPAIAMADDDGRDAILSRLLTVDTRSGQDSGDRAADRSQSHSQRGILSNLIYIDVSGLTSDRDRRGDQDRDEDGILNNLLTIGTGSDRDEDRRNDTGRDSRNDRDNNRGEGGILSDLVSIDGGGVFSSNDDDDDGLLGVL